MVVVALAVLVSCSEAPRPAAPSALVGRITQISVMDCFDASTVDAKGRPLSCESSAVEIVGGEALIVSDKETPDELPSPIFWVPIQHPWPDVLASTAIRHESNATIRGTRKIEGLAKSAEGDVVFATSDFDWAPDGTSAEPDLYNRLLYWPTGHVDHAAIANPTSNGGVVSSVSLRPHFAAALKSDKYPAGPPYFKVEGLVAMPNRELWFGVREVGPDYEHPDYTVTILSASYLKSDDGKVTVRPPFSVVARVDPSPTLPSSDRLGLSSLARHGDALLMITTREAPEGHVGHESYLWGARLSEGPGLDFRVAAGTDGQPFKLPCKAEGFDFVSPSRLLVVCDEDRSLSTFVRDGGERFTRRPDQAVVMVVDVSGLG